MLYLSGEECAHLCSCLKHCAADLLHYANTTQTPISPPPQPHQASLIYTGRGRNGLNHWTCQFVCVWGHPVKALTALPSRECNQRHKEEPVRKLSSLIFSDRENGPHFASLAIKSANDLTAANLDDVWFQKWSEMWCCFFFSFLPSGASATLSTFANENNQISLTGSQLSAAELDCIRAIKAKVSWTWDIDCLPSRGLEHRR